MLILIIPYGRVLSLEGEVVGTESEVAGSYSSLTGFSALNPSLSRSIGDADLDALLNVDDVVGMDDLFRIIGIFI